MWDLKPFRKYILYLQEKKLYFFNMRLNYFFISILQLKKIII